MTITREEVARIAALASLALTEEEVAALVGELGAVLRHVEALARVDAGEPVPEPDRGGAPLREDRVAYDALHRPLAELAPDWRDGHFVVPRPAGLEGEEPGG